MNNYIEKKHFIDNSRLDGSDYVNSLLGEALSLGLIGDAEIGRVRSGILDELYVLCTRLTGGDSSSIRAELAAELAQSCTYQIGLALRAADDGDKALAELTGKSIHELYTRGHGICVSLFEDTKRFYKKAVASTLPVANSAYESIRKVFGKYLTSYNTDYFASRVPGDIDYPLYCPVDGFAGIEYANEYLMRFNIENSFCSHFPAGNIAKMLVAYGGDVDDMYINVYELTLTNALGCTLAGRDILSLTLDKHDISYLCDRFAGLNAERARALIESAYVSLCGELKITSGTAKAYFLSGVENIASRCAVNPEGVFICARTEKKAESVYTACAPMERTRFTALVEAIYKCENTQEKLTLSGEIESIYDLTDLMISDCFAYEELGALLSTLDDASLAVLVKLNPYYATDDGRIAAAMRDYFSVHDDVRKRADALSKTIEIKN